MPCIIRFKVSLHSTHDHHDIEMKIENDANLRRLLPLFLQLSQLNRNGCCYARKNPIFTAQLTWMTFTHQPIHRSMFDNEKNWLNSLFKWQWNDQKVPPLAITWQKPISRQLSQWQLLIVQNDQWYKLFVTFNFQCGTILVVCGCQLKSARGSKIFINEISIVKW